MKNKKIIIAYYAGIKNTIIFWDLILKNKDLIEKIYELSIIPKKEGRINHRFFKNLFLSKLIFKIFLFWISFGYNFFGKRSIKKLCKKLKIKHEKINSINQVKLKKKQYLVASISEIIPKEFLSKYKNVLIPHEGEMPQWKGSALYFHYLLSKEKYAYSTLFYPTKDLDKAKKIYCKSKPIKIKGNSVVSLWYKLIYANSKNVELFFNNFRNNKFIIKNINTKKKIKPFTFPNRLDFQNLKQRKKIFCNFKDLKFLT